MSMVLFAAAAAAQPAAKETTTPRQAAAKKLADAQGALRQALVEVAKAEKDLQAALDETARAEAEKSVAAARARLEAARKEIARWNAEALRNVAQEAAIHRGMARQLPAERETVDPRDPFERFALLTPGGPVVVKAALSIDGQPFRLVRERFIDQMLAAADENRDGKVEWDEALAAPKFTLGRISGAAPQRQAYLKALDVNSNGVADRPEVRRFLAQYFQGPTFLLGGSGFDGFSGGFVAANGRVAAPGAASDDVRLLLDVNRDGVLDEAEIAATAARLKSFDEDDNDLVDSMELASAPTRDASRGKGAPIEVVPATQFALLLGPTATAETVFSALALRYQNSQGELAGGFSALPGLLESLDKNSDGKLDQDEALALDEVPPHVELAVDLSPGGTAKGIKLVSLAESIAKTKETNDSISLALPGAQLSLTASRAAQPAGRYASSARSLMGRYDKDGNAYLEKGELPAQFEQQFALWDVDENGKVFADEIEASYERMQAPQASQVVASVAAAANSLFGVLDASGDRRLSLREMQSAAARMQALDADRDGRLSLVETPAVIAVSFGLGYSAFPPYGASSGGGGEERQAANSPEWFVRMDRNGDGDVTLKEFLGTPEQFRRLDADGDGFVIADEARAAGAK
jgi:Ca2+-binding EF-hand superfamily protein